LKDRFGLAVVELLPPVISKRSAPEMPDESSRVEAEGSTSRLKSPAKVDIIASDPKPRIKPTNRFERRPTTGKVAAGKVFGLAIGEEDVGWVSRRVCDAVGKKTVTGGSEVRPTNRCKRGPDKGRR